jgi:hypothetical protein
VDFFHREEADRADAFGDHHDVAGDHLLGAVTMGWHQDALRRSAPGAWGEAAQREPGLPVFGRPRWEVGGCCVVVVVVRLGRPGHSPTLLGRQPDHRAPDSERPRHHDHNEPSCRLQPEYARQLRVLTAIPPQSGRAQTEICRSTTAPPLKRRSAATAACCDAVANAPGRRPRRGRR